MKSQWQPVQRLTWLGFVIDTSLGHLEVPTEKITLLRRQIQQTLSMNQIPARLLASVVGRVIAMGLAIGPLTRFKFFKLMKNNSIHMLLQELA